MYPTQSCQMIDEAYKVSETQHFAGYLFIYSIHMCHDAQKIQIWHTRILKYHIFWLNNSHFDMQFAILLSHMAVHII